MNGTEKVIKHLEMAQSVINRLGRNSFLLKSWSMTILVAAMVLISKNIPGSYIALMLLLPIACFWTLDGYFLWQERLFRQLYDQVRQQADTDFSMNVGRHAGERECTWPSAIFSVTLLVFYLAEVVLVCAVALLFRL